MCLQGTSPRGVELLTEALLTEEFPTRIKSIPISTDDLLATSSINQIFNHMLSTIGLGVSTKGPHPLVPGDDNCEKNLT